MKIKNKTSRREIRQEQIVTATETPFAARQMVLARAEKTSVKKRKSLARYTSNCPISSPILTMLSVTLPEIAVREAPI